MDQIGTRHRLDLYNIKKELTGPPPTRMWPTLYWGPGGLMGEDEDEDEDEDENEDEDEDYCEGVD